MKRYFVRRRVGIEQPDPSDPSLHRRLQEGEVVEVPDAPIMRKGFIFYKRMGTPKYPEPVDRQVIAGGLFTIYFREPTEEELALIILSEV